MKRQPITSLRIRNFKAIQDSGTVKLGPFTLLIGNNGSGKSSLVEGLETLERIVQDDVDSAMAPWHGFEHVWNRAVPHAEKPDAEGKRAHQTNPMGFAFTGRYADKATGAYRAEIEVTAGSGRDSLFIRHEKVAFPNGARVERDDSGFVKYDPALGGREIRGLMADGKSVMQGLGLGGLGRWQFLTLVPQDMGEPVPQKRAGGEVRMAKDGRNVAQYLHWVREQERPAFEGILEAMQSVLPYARDLQPAVTSELERTVYLQLTEQDFKVPGWLLSTGTLRILALLAVLRSPRPPPLLVVEELENGLDPRSVQIVLREIENAVASGRTQVIATTHSPYLLDLTDLSNLVLCERIEGVPRFVRPSTFDDLQAWSEQFSPGKLYTMGLLAVERRDGRDEGGDDLRKRPRRG